MPPAHAESVVLDGASLTLDALEAVARHGAAVALAPARREAVVRGARAWSTRPSARGAGRLRRHHRLRQLRRRA